MIVRKASLLNLDFYFDYGFNIIVFIYLHCEITVNTVKTRSKETEL